MSSLAGEISAPDRGLPFAVRRASAARRAWRLARREPLGAAGAVALSVLVVLAVFAPLIATYDPQRLEGLPFAGPSSDFLFGTDYAGRDLFSRIVYGTRISLTVGVASVLLGITAGAALGVVSGYTGGIVDSVIQRVVDGFMAFPPILLAMSAVFALGFSIGNVIIAIAVAFAPRAARVFRLHVMGVRRAQFVESARAVGAGTPRIIARHIVPHCLSPYVVMVSISLAGAIIAEASLSFLGLGVPPPEPSWGGMLSGPTLAHFEDSPHMAIFPGLFLSITTLSINLFGDAVRNVIDPRLRL